MEAWTAEQFQKAWIYVSFPRGLSDDYCKMMKLKKKATAYSRLQKLLLSLLVSSLFFSVLMDIGVGLLLLAIGIISFLFGMDLFPRADDKELQKKLAIHLAVPLRECASEHNKAVEIVENALLIGEVFPDGKRDDDTFQKIVSRVVGVLVENKRILQNMMVDYERLREVPFDTMEKFGALVAQRIGTGITLPALFEDKLIVLQANMETEMAMLSHHMQELHVLPSTTEG